MRPPNYLAIGLLIFGLIQTFSTTEVKAQRKADQLRAIERQRLRALVDADMTTASRLHADDFELINPRGGTLSKEQYLRDIASGDLNYLEWQPGEIRVRLYGKSAVIRYQARLRVSVEGSPGRPVTFWHKTFTKSGRGNGKLSGHMPLSLMKRARIRNELWSRFRRNSYEAQALYCSRGFRCAGGTRS